LEVIFGQTHTNDQLLIYMTTKLVGDDVALKNNSFDISLLRNILTLVEEIQVYLV